MSGNCPDPPKKPAVNDDDSLVTGHDRTVMVQALSELGPYRLTKLLGRGGMGEVWQAFDSNLERDVAVKLMRKELLANEEAVKRFAREARAVARLNHPNIVQVYAFGDQEGILYFVMELVEGETITQRMKRCGVVPLQESVFMLLQAIEGLSYANARGIIHRDIKPSNLMLTPDYRVKIADFGLAKMVEQDTQMTAAGTTMGSPNYMSPEQARGEEADHRSDIYALGISWFQMLTGELPFTAQTAISVLLKQIQEPLPEPAALKAIAEGKALEVIKKMTAKDPEERYQTYGGLAAAISALAPDVRVKGGHIATTSMPASQPGQAATGAAAGAHGTDVLISGADATQTGAPPDAAPPGISTPPPPPPPGVAAVAGTPTPDQTRTYQASAGESAPAPARKASNVALIIAGLAALVAIAGFFAFRQFRPATTEPDPISNQTSSQQPVSASPIPQVSPAPAGTPAPTPAPQTIIIYATPSPIPDQPAVTELTPAVSEIIYTPTPTPVPTPRPIAQLQVGPNLPQGARVPVTNEAGQRIGELPAGSQVRLVRATGQGNAARYQIDYQDRVGYLAANQASLDFAAPGSGPTEVPSDGPVMVELIVPGSSGGEIEVYLNSSPIKPIRTFPAGTRLQKNGESENMIRVILPGNRQGWVLRAATREVQP